MEYHLLMIAPLLALFLAQTQPARQAPAQHPAQTQTTTPALAPPQAAPAGRGGRGGGIGGPGPAVGGEVDETPVVTHHSVNVHGKVLNYTATVAQMPLKNAATGETEAHI